MDSQSRSRGALRLEDLFGWNLLGGPVMGCRAWDQGERNWSSLALSMRQEGNHPWLIEASEACSGYGDAPPHAVPALARLTRALCSRGSALHRLQALAPDSKCGRSPVSLGINDPARNVGLHIRVAAPPLHALGMSAEAAYCDYCELPYLCTPPEDAGLGGRRAHKRWDCKMMMLQPMLSLQDIYICMAAAGQPAP